MNNKTIIEFGCHMMWRITYISEDVIHLSPQPRWITSSSICRIFHILGTQPHSIIANYTFHMTANHFFSLPMVGWECRIKRLLFPENTLMLDSRNLNKSLDIGVQKREKEIYICGIRHPTPTKWSFIKVKNFRTLLLFFMINHQSVGIRS